MSKSAQVLSVDWLLKKIHHQKQNFKCSLNKSARFSISNSSKLHKSTRQMKFVVLEKL